MLLLFQQVSSSSEEEEDYQDGQLEDQFDSQFDEESISLDPEEEEFELIDNIDQPQFAVADKPSAVQKRKKSSKHYHQTSSQHHKKKKPKARRVSTSPPLEPRSDSEEGIFSQEQAKRQHFRRQKHKMTRGDPDGSLREANQIKQLQEDNRQLKKKKAELSKEIKEKDQEISRKDLEIKQQDLSIRALKQENEKLQEKLANAGNPGLMPIKQKPSQEVLKLIDKTVKYKLFKDVKFVVNEKALEKVSAYMHKLMYENSQNKPNRENWVYTYSNSISKSINDKRNYAQSQLKAACIKYANENGTGLVPTYKAILKIALRDVDTENDDEMELFKWYWDVALGKVAGVQHVWTDSIKYYSTISAAKDVISHGTEAFICLLFDNCEEKWNQTIKYLANHPELQGKIPEKKAIKAMPETTQVEREAKRELWDLCQGKYTKQDGGQQVFGGWDKAGLLKFKDLQQQIKASRVNNNMKVNDIEKAVLQNLRDTKGISSADAQAEKKKKRKRRVAQEEKVDSDVEMDYDFDV